MGELLSTLQPTVITVKNNTTDVILINNTQSIAKDGHFCSCISGNITIKTPKKTIVVSQPLFDCTYRWGEYIISVVGEDGIIELSPCRSSNIKLESVTITHTVPQL